MLKKNFTRESLTNSLHKNLGFSKNICNNLIDDLFEELILGLKNSSKVKISSFGTFRKIKKKERIGRNPKTKESAKISAREVIVFKASKKIKDKLNR